MFTMGLAGRAVKVTDPDEAHARDVFGSEGSEDEPRSPEREDGNGIIMPFLISAELPGGASARPN